MSSVTARDIPTCPIHRERITLRQGPHGDYWCCPMYPKGCEMIADFNEVGELVGFSDQRTRNARKHAHFYFDHLWKRANYAYVTRREAMQPVMSRGAAYNWLARAMGLTPEACHMKLFTYEQCQRVIALVRQKMEESREHV